jgi:predicted nucleic acid-binding protein
MKRQRIYIDTSIVGGFFDVEFEKETKMFFQRLENKEIIFVMSDLLFKELENAPPKVKYLLENYDKNFLEKVIATDEVSELAEKYIAEKVVGRTSLDDCKHIALATINKVDVLASWNFKHIVNLERIKGYNGVNLKMGYSTIEIRNPKDLIYYGEGI